MNNRFEVKYTTEAANQGRLIQWARWARAQGPQASGGPKQPMCYFSFREIIVTV